MKKYLFLYLILVNFTTKGQVTNNSFSNLNESKNIPVFDLNVCTQQLLKILVENCMADTNLSKYPYCYLFYSKNNDSCFSINIKPMETPTFYSLRYYGVFEVCGQKFYCIGDKPDLLQNKMLQDSIEIKLSNKPKNDSSAFYFDVDRFFDLNTIQVTETFKINNKSYSFFIQPCTNWKKKELRRFKFNHNCE